MRNLFAIEIVILAHGKVNERLIWWKQAMEIEIIFMDAAAPKKIVCDNVYTKGQMLCVRQGEFIYKYPLIHIFSVCHKHGCHIGSREHQRKIGLIKD